MLIEGTKRVKITGFIDREKYLTCSYIEENDIIEKTEDLVPLALTAVKRLEKLTCSK